jgi:ribosomal silencing factor RsfS
MKKFVETDYMVIHTGNNKEGQIRLIADDIVMYKELTVEQMKSVRDQLDKMIKEAEA